MIFLQNVLTVFISQFLMGRASAVEPVPQLSLWGKAAHFSSTNTHWKLKPHVSIPALREFTVCLSLKLEDTSTSTWVAFLYRNPEAYSELGIGAKFGTLLVWLFGTQWETREITLSLSQWHSLCLTWSHLKERPAFYINGTSVDLMIDYPGSSCPPSPAPCPVLAPNGTLTLGASHRLTGGNIDILPFSRVPGKVSLFRLWERERSMQEVSSLYCTEGDVLRWEGGDWDAGMDSTLPDSSLQCVWSKYEVTVFYIIIAHDRNNTDVDEAREMMLHWLGVKLPDSVSLHTVSVFEDSRFSTEDGPQQTTRGARPIRWVPPMSRFYSVVHLSFSPSLDVAAAQTSIKSELGVSYLHPARQWQLEPDPTSIHCTPVESFATATTASPQITTTPPSSTPSPTTTAATTTTIITAPQTTASSTMRPSSSTPSPTTTAATTTITAPQTTTASSTMRPSSSTPSPTTTAATTTTTITAPQTTTSSTRRPSSSTPSPTTTAATTATIITAPQTTTASSTRRPSSSTPSPTTTAATTATIITAPQTTTASSTMRPSSSTPSPTTTAATTTITSPQTTTALSTRRPSSSTPSPTTTAATTTVTAPQTTTALSTMRPSSSTLSPTTTAATTKTIITAPQTSTASSQITTTPSSTPSPTTTTTTTATTSPPGTTTALSQITATPSSTPSPTTTAATTTTIITAPQTTAASSQITTTSSSSPSPTTTTTTTTTAATSAPETTKASSQTTTAPPSSSATTTAAFSSATASSTTSSPETTTKSFHVTTTAITTTPPPPQPTPTVLPTPGTTTTITTSGFSPEAASASTIQTSPAILSEFYFEVKLNASITGGCDTEHIIRTWLSSCLPDDMTVLNLQLLPKVQRNAPELKANVTSSDGVRGFVLIESREKCVFQVRVMSQTDTEQMEEQIRDLLSAPYINGDTTIVVQDIQINRILIVHCSPESHQTRKGLFQWPETLGGQNASQWCPKNPHHNATRQCKLTLSTHWMDPDLEDCAIVVETIPDLDHVHVTAGNALDVVEMIKDLLINHLIIGYEDLVTILNKLRDIVNKSVVTPDLGQALIDIISDILETESDLLPFINTILNITESIGDKMVGYEGSSTLVASAIAIAVVDMVPPLSGTLTFGVSSDLTGKKPQIYINRYPASSTVAFISLPSILQHSFPQTGPNQSPPRVQFQFYGIPMFFKTGQTDQILNTFVVSASVTNVSSPIKDLDEDISVTLHHLTPSKPYDDVQCVYWNFNKNDGNGGWDDHGCRKNKSSSDNTTCLCDHLTHFGVLLDVSRTPLDPAHEQILTIITYAGCGVSSLFLGITVLTYTVFEKLRRDYPSQILINLCLALLGLNLLFLVNSWLSSWGLNALCVAVAFTQHYFLLASFTWMGLEAVNMYFALVKVFNVYVPSYILKFCILGWGIPLIICILVLIVNRDAYGADDTTGLNLLHNTDNFCWLQDNVTFYVSVVAYAVIIFLFNIAIFVVVLIQIRHMRVNSPAGTRSGLMQDLKGVSSLTLLLGLTWTVGFFTWGPARVFLLYLFSALNTLQGLFLFIFHCLMKENVRKQWRIHLCLGRFRLDEYSEWSNSASAAAVAKPRSSPPRRSGPSVYSVRSNSTDSTSASSDSSQRALTCKRPDLGLFVNSLVLPRAQRIPTATGAVPSQRDVSPTAGWRSHLLDQQEYR